MREKLTPPEPRVVEYDVTVDAVLKLEAGESDDLKRRLRDLFEEYDSDHEDQISVEAREEL